MVLQCFSETKRVRNEIFENAEELFQNWDWDNWDNWEKKNDFFAKFIDEYPFLTENRRKEDISSGHITIRLGSVDSLIIANSLEGISKNSRYFKKVTDIPKDSEYFKNLIDFKTF